MANDLKILDSFRLRDDDNGYTIIEMLFVCAIIVVISLMGMGAYAQQRKFGMETICVTRLKQIAQYQESFRDLGDPSLNPDASFGTFFELQNAGYIPANYVSEDNDAHTVEPFIPYYKIEIVRSPTGLTEEPDRNQYFVIASPVSAPYDMRIFMMQEDGEVYFFKNNYDGIRYVWD